jgi:type II secretory pathway pseudopilin PulG
MGMAELLVSMVLTAIMATILVSFFASVTRSFTSDSLASQSTNSATTAMKETTRVIRSGTELLLDAATKKNAPVFVAASSRSLTMFAFLDTNAADPQPVKIAFSLNSTGELGEMRWTAHQSSDGHWTFDTTPSSTRVIARGISNAVTDPLFAYIDVDGETIAASSAGAVSSANIPLIAAVRVRVVAQADPNGHAQAAEMENTVGIPNLGLSRIAAVS